MGLRENAKLWQQWSKGDVVGVTPYAPPPAVTEAGNRLATAILSADVVGEGGCPWCGASVDEAIYHCGTVHTVKPLLRSNECYNRQIDRLTAALAVDRDRLMKQSAELATVKAQLAELKRD